MLDQRIVHGVDLSPKNFAAFMVVQPFCAAATILVMLVAKITVGRRGGVWLVHSWYLKREFTELLRSGWEP